MWKKNLIFKNIIHVYEWYIETFISKQKIYEDWAYIFDSKPATLFIPCSVLLNFAVFKLIPIFILIHKWILWHLSLACGHNCLGCYRINARQVLLKKNFTSVPALKVNFPVNSIRKTGGGLVEIGRGGSCSCNIVFSNLNKVLATFILGWTFFFFLIGRHISLCNFGLPF